MTEIWRDIPGYEGLYQASNKGAIKRVARTIYYPTHRFTKQRRVGDMIMKQKKTPHGYMYMKLYKDGKAKDVFVHRLIAWTFLPPVEGKNYIDHLDGNKTNNCVDNLEWVTIAENNQRAYDKGLKRRIHAGQFLKGMNRQQQYINRRK
jgi:hypothetical protein